MTQLTDDLSLGSRLVGWKRIANYLGCSERTARRWEREEQLPVHRQQHEKRSTVFALPAELDRWLGGRADLPSASVVDEVTNAERKRGPTLAVLASVVLLVIAVFAIWTRSGLDGGNTERDPIAVDFFERGTALWRQRGDVPNRQAVKLLSQAVERDETFAEAWSALATAWMTLPTYSDEVSVTEATEEALLAADRALRLDPSLVEARSVMASVAKGRGDWLLSERIYLDALEIDPDSASLMLWFAGHYRELGLIDKAMALTDAALRLEPNSPPMLAESAMYYYQLGHIERAQQMLDFLWFDLAVEVPVVWFGRWMIMLETQEYAAANAWLAESPFSVFAPTLQSYIEFSKNKESDPSSLVSEIKTAYRNGLPGWLAFHMLDINGLSDAALEILDRESSDGYIENSVVLFFERGGDTRMRPEFADLIERLGYYEYWRVRGSPDMCARDSNSALCQRLSESTVETQPPC